MTISNESRGRIKKIFEPIALAMGRLGLTPDGLTAHRLRDHRRRRGARRPLQLWVVGGIVVFIGGVFDMFDGTLARATGTGQPARRVHGLHLRPLGRDHRLPRHHRRGAVPPASRTSPILVAAAAMGAAFMVSYARAKSDGLGFSSGMGMAAVGLMPREIRLVILARPRPRRDDARHSRPSQLALGDHRSSAPSSPSSSGSSTSAARPSSRPPATGQPRRTENNVSNNGKNGSNGKNGATPTNTWAGAGRRGDGKIRVAIVGVGNCASSLVQGRYYYENAKADDFVPGLMHVDLGGYHVRDIEFVAAFDIDKNKVGKDLSEAIYTKPNNTYVFQQVPHTGVTVERGMTHDGLGKYLSQIIEKAPGPDGRHRRHPQGARSRRHGLATSRSAARRPPSGTSSRPSRPASAFVNAIPVFIGREPYWQRRFAEAGLPVIGDDIKSQVGATISHRVLTRLFMDRGVRLDRTYQLNFGGNTDFLNMLERERLESKKISKTNAVTSMLDYEIDPDDVHVGPSDHVPWLLDRKWCYIRMEGTTFGDVPLNAELKLEVWDSPNSAGVITDAIRCLKLGLDRGLRARSSRRRATS